MNIRKPLPTHSVNFPDPWILPPESDGLIYIGGNLKPETLIKAYRVGIFPWPLEEGYPLFWFCPEPRGVLDFDRIHWPRSLRKWLSKQRLRLSLNTAFAQVMRECAKQPRPGQDGTWILPELFPAYEEFHRLGYAHSIECWRENELVGGLYGVYLQGVFSGESMFHQEPNVSKLCLLEMARMLKDSGLQWMDIQMLTPVTEHLGGTYISRRDFLLRLQEVHRQDLPEKIVLEGSWAFPPEASKMV
jgi:leucyl/phenylalanyl-tRNA---protein transferase